MIVGSLVWLAATLALGVAAPRLARRGLPAERWPTSELFLRSVLVATLVIVAATAVAGVLGGLGRWTLLAAAVLAWIASRALAATGAATSGKSRLADQALAAREVPRSARWSVFGVRAPFALTGAVVTVDTLLALPTPPTSWDAMTYHLFLPARWLQEGRIFHVPTVFFDNHAAYAPQNGALFHAWNMALSGSDALTTAAQGLMVLFAAVALYRLALELGAPRHAAAWITPPAVLLVPVRRWGYSANVDLFMVAFFLGAAYWTLAHARRGDRSSALAAALAAGLAVGTKTAGLALLAAPFAVLAAALLARRRVVLAPVTALLTVAAGGFWYLRNLLLYDNPLFPLDFGLGPIHFDGAYRSEALRQSFLNVDWPRWLEVVDVLVGRAAWISALLGVVLLLAAARRGRRAPAAGLAVFCLGWAWFCYAIQPYNNQTRFLIPSLLVAQLGFALALARIQDRRRRSAVGVALALVLLATATPRAALWPRIAKLTDAGVDPQALLAAAALPLAVLVFAARRRLPRWAVAPAVVAACWPLLLAGQLACERARPFYYAHTDFKFYAPGYLLFSKPDLDPLRIAYSGFSTPYVLMGSTWRHRVVYLETPVDAGAGFHDYFRREPVLGESHKPGLYRRADDRPGPWLERLEAERIDFVALFTPVAVERPDHWPLDGEFPIERRWLRHYPKAHLLVATPLTEVYRIER